MTAEERDALAGEYVLGTLPEAERHIVQLQLATDAELAAAVRGWEDRLSGLAVATPPVAPPPAVWDRIVAATQREPAPPIPFARPQPRRTDDATVRASLDKRTMDALRRRVSVWRTVAAASGAIAAGFAALVFSGVLNTAVPDNNEDRYVAVIDRGGALPALLVDVNTATGVIAVVSVAAEAPPGRSYELWYITEGQDPRSLGLVNDVGERLSVPIDSVDGFNATQATFAISEEPPGGSPTGAPTGPVVYTGTLIPAPQADLSL